MRRDPSRGALVSDDATGLDKDFLVGPASLGGLQGPPGYGRRGSYRRAGLHRPLGARQPTPVMRSTSWVKLALQWTPLFRARSFDQDRTESLSPPSWAGTGTRVYMGGGGLAAGACARASQLPPLPRSRCSGTALDVSARQRPHVLGPGSRCSTTVTAPDVRAPAGAVAGPLRSWELGDRLAAVVRHPDVGPVRRDGTGNVEPIARV